MGYDERKRRVVVIEMKTGDSLELADMVLNAIAVEDKGDTGGGGVVGREMGGEVEGRDWRF